MLEKRIILGTLAILGTAALVHGCGSETNGSGGNGAGDGGESGAAGSSTGATSQGGSQSTGGSGGASSGGSGTSGTSGSGASGSSGASGAPSGGDGGTSGGSGSSGEGGGGAGAGGEGGGSAGRAGAGGAGAGGAPTTCNPNSDAMDMCGRLGASCLCCPIGGPMETCICTTQCTTDDDCTEPSRPHCNIDTRFTERGICTPEEFVCRWGSRCAAPHTPIATPSGDRPISELCVGDLVYSIEDRAVVVVPIRAVQRVPVSNAHTVSRVTLASGAVLEISAGHPTADGRSFGDLHAGDELGGLHVETVVQAAPYAYPFTHDILPDSTSGAYFAAGALIGSTLAE